MFSQFFKNVSEGKRRIMETQIFHHAKNRIFKKSSERNQNPSRYQTLELISSFQNKPKHQFSKKSSYKKIDLLLLLPRGL
jgi:hypothetical protein